MKIKNILLWLLSMSTVGAPAHGQVLSNTWSKVGHAEPRQAIVDHVTVADQDNGEKLIQFTEHAGHYLSFTGIPDSEAPIIVDLTGMYLDGLASGHAPYGQCVFVYKAPGELESINCPNLLFTVTQ
jgi:hypothetical protein